MTAIASQITSLTIVYLIVYSGTDKIKHQSSASLAFVRGISPGTGEFPAQRASYAENVSIWWRHHEGTRIDNNVFVHQSRHRECLKSRKPVKFAVSYMFSNQHYSDVIMTAMVSQIIDVTIIYSNICSGANQRKHQSSASLAFVSGNHRWMVISPLKGPVMWKMFPFDAVIMSSKRCEICLYHYGYNHVDMADFGSMPTNIWSIKVYLRYVCPVKLL